MFPLIDELVKLEKKDFDNFTLELKFENGKQVILLNGIDRGDDIRTPKASMAASAVSAIPEVREYLLEMQRNTAKKNSVIMDGRDIGTVILPDAEVKIFLTASAKARAMRRHKELLAKGSDITFEQVYNEMVERDKNDSTRDVAPCVQAKDAILIDNSNLSEAETVEKILQIVKKKTKDTTTLYTVLKAIVAPIYKVLFNIKVKGLENIPKNGGVLLCPNHISAIDVISIGVVCPRQISCLAKKELFDIPLIGGFLKSIGGVRIDRGGADVGALKAAIGALNGGKTLAIFPQGHRYPSVNPATTPVRHGAGLIAYHAGCDVIPVCINPKKGKYGLFSRTEVVFGKPLKYSDLGFKNGGRDEYAHATEMIFDEVVRLGNFSSLPAYDPALEKAKKKKKRK